MKTKGLTKQDSLCIKGIAVTMLLFYHLFREKSLFEGYSVSFYPFTEEFVLSVSMLCKICVGTFAFVTGYGLLKSIEKTTLCKKSVELWSINRLLKTMSGFYFVYVIAFIVTQIISALPAKTYFSGSVTNGIIYMLLDFLGLSGLFSTPLLNGTWWYMSAAILFILFVPLIYTAAKKIGYLPILALAIALPHLLNTGFPGGRNPFTFLPPMILGMIFSDYDIFERISDKLPKNKVLSYVTGFAVFGSICVFCYFASGNIDYNKYWEFDHTVVTVSFICFFRYVIVRIPVIKNVLEFLGKHSMTIFLTHTFIRYTYLNEFTYSFGNFIKIFAVLYALSLALALVLDAFKGIIRYDKLFNKFTHKIIKRIEES